MDKILVERGLAETRHKAQALIMAGLVFSGERRLEKPGQLVARDAALAVRKPLPFVGRGGLKLEEALDRFGIDVRGAACADIGSSTGGFTDCLLKRGAARVYAVDVDTRQIDPRLRADPRVILVEKNARFLVPGDFTGPVSLVAMDVSFISILKVLPAIKAVLGSGGGLSQPETAGPSGPERRSALILIKPQFEAGRGQVGRTGVIRDPSLHAQILERVVREASGLGFALRGLLRSSTPGQRGNREFFGLWSPGGLPPDAGAVVQWIREVTRDESR